MPTGTAPRGGAQRLGASVFPLVLLLALVVVGSGVFTLFQPTVSEDDLRNRRGDRPRSWLPRGGLSMLHGRLQHGGAAGDSVWTSCNPESVRPRARAGSVVLLASRSS